MSEDQAEPTAGATERGPDGPQPEPGTTAGPAEAGSAEAAAQADLRGQAELAAQAAQAGRVVEELERGLTGELPMAAAETVVELPMEPGAESGAWDPPRATEIPETQALLPVPTGLNEEDRNLGEPGDLERRESRPLGGADDPAARARDDAGPATPAELSRGRGVADTGLRHAGSEPRPAPDSPWSASLEPHPGPEGTVRVRAIAPRPSAPGPSRAELPSERAVPRAPSLARDLPGAAAPLDAETTLDTTSGVAIPPFQASPPILHEGVTAIFSPRVEPRAAPPAHGPAPSAERPDPARRSVPVVDPDVTLDTSATGAHRPAPAPTEGPRPYAPPPQAPPARAAGLPARPPPSRSPWGWIVLGGALGIGLGFGARSCFSGDEGGGFAASGKPVGVVEVLGAITDAKTWVRELERFAANDRLEAIVVRIDSPGGAVAPSQEAFEAMRAASERKPVVVSIGSTAASGGFWIAMGGDWIVASPGSITGSIGVISQLPDLRGVAQWAGVSLRTFRTGPYKDIGNPLREPTPGEETVFMELLGDVFDQFVSLIAERRHLSPDFVRTFADGRVFSGRRAFELGLVDQLGGLDLAARRALQLAEDRRAAAGNRKPQPVTDAPNLVYPRKPSPSIFELFAEQAGESAMRGASRELVRSLSEVRGGTQPAAELR